jgi:excisionase family DNA binding protein
MAGHRTTRYSGGLTAPRPLLTVNDVALTLAISRDSVYRLVRQGALNPVRVGERLRFRQSDIDAYLDRTG